MPIPAELILRVWPGPVGVVAAPKPIAVNPAAGEDDGDDDCGC